jgi:FkbM family methyltransferase
MDELNGKNIRDLVGRDDPTILEIGCNDGTDTLLFLEAMPRATIYCFEPDPRAIERFHKTVSDCRATLIEAAVCCEDGEALFYGSSGRPPNRSRKPGAPRACWLPEWDLSGSLLQPTGHLAYCPWATFPQDRQYKVRTVRLDTWMEERPEISQIDFIWCDVQGAEALVIQGGKETLAVTRYFYTEFNNVPLYEGQLPLTKLQELLPNFDCLGIYGKENTLFRNRQLKCKSPS